MLDDAAPSGCCHSPSLPYAGMKMVDRTHDEVVFRCPRCALEYIALRCRAAARADRPWRGQSSGTRCGKIARAGHVTCWSHRQEEAAGLVATT